MVLDALLDGAIVAFDKLDCPAGWEEYDLAAGRSLRGIGGEACVLFRETGGTELHEHAAAVDRPSHLHRKDDDCCDPSQTDGHVPFLN